MGEEKMATVIRAKISENNKYYIDKHRHYELKHFCLQYNSWKRSCAELDGYGRKGTDDINASMLPGDPTAKCVELKSGYLERMDLVRRTAFEADPELAEYIFKAVTEGLSYTYLSSVMNIPCGRDMYYDRYRRFFWLLNKARN